MYTFDIQTGSVADSLSDVQSSLIDRNIVGEEPTWRVPCANSAVALSASKVVATRWYGSDDRTQEFEAETPIDCHIVKIVLRNTNIRFGVGGRTVQDGAITPGTVHVTGPSIPVHCLFRGPYDVLHLHVPNALIAECAREMTGRTVPVLGLNGVPRRDMTVDALSRALLDADRVGGSFGQLYAECIGTAIIARLLASANRVAERPKVTALARWRLKRAIDYFEAQIGKPVSLAAVAAAAGLTRMHFAAQFRAATGLSPHEYLLRRRIERAQGMLAETGMSLVDIALSVGFQTQSHFTSVFKRYAGQPPRAWRESRAVRVRGSIPPGRPHRQ
jgi:AraC family transcriptional regulator